MLKILSNPYVLVALLLALGGSFFWGMRVGADREVATQARIEARVRQTEDASARAAAEAIARIEVVNKTTRQVLEREIVEKPVYRDCRNTDVGMRAIDAALENRPVPASDSGVPETNTPSR